MKLFTQLRYPLSGHAYGQLGSLGHDHQVVHGGNRVIRRVAAYFGYLLGSDYIFPRTANYVLGKYLIAHGGELVAEKYTPLGH